jgi:hypothetical protein
LLTHFPIIIIIFSRFDVSGQIIFQPKWAIWAPYWMNTFELEMKCARFLQSTSRLSTFSVGPFTTVTGLIAFIASQVS